LQREQIPGELQASPSHEDLAGRDLFSANDRQANQSRSRSPNRQSYRWKMRHERIADSNLDDLDLWLLGGGGQQSEVVEDHHGRREEGGCSQIHVDAVPAGPTAGPVPDGRGTEAAVPAGPTESTSARVFGLVFQGWGGVGPNQE